MRVDLPEIVLEKPDDLDQRSWQAIMEHTQRLNRALVDRDQSLAIGCSKELVESVARVVLTSRGDPTADRAEYGPVVSAAHRELEYQPGPDLAMNAPVRKIASAAKKIAEQLRELRNDYGTGHGRAAAPSIEDEAVVIAVEASLLWVRWALRRLQHLLAGQLAPLLDHLSGSSMSRESWRAKLVAANISSLPEPDQRRLGVAVGQRASSGTFVVREVGMEEPLADPNGLAWPPAYRMGAVEGAFIDAEGHLDVHAPVVKPAAGFADSVPDSAELLRELRSKIEDASWSMSFAESWRDVVSSMRMNAGEIGDQSARQEWDHIISIIQSTGALLNEQ